MESYNLLVSRVYFDLMNIIDELNENILDFNYV